LKENLNHVLHPFIDICFVENTAELIEDGQSYGRAHLFQMLANFSCQTDRDLYRVV
jgi:hypothetical protein